MVLTDTLPANVTFVSAVPSQGICNQASGTVTCTLGSINSGASATVTITAKPTLAAGGTTITNSATVTSGVTDPDNGNNTSNQSTTVGSILVADISVSKSDAPDPVVAGNIVIYTVTVTNNGPSQATGVVMIDTLPANVTFGSASSSQGSCSEASGTVTCSLGTINNGANASVTITVIPTLTAGGTTITNTAIAASGVNDLSLLNNAISESTTVNEAVTAPPAEEPVITATPFPEVTVVDPENINAPLPERETLAVVQPTTPATIELHGQGIKLSFPAPVQQTTFLTRLKVVEPVSLAGTAS